MGITSADSELKGIEIGRNVLLEFSDYHEWRGPLDPRPECARIVRNAHLVAPALQVMVESLPEGDLKAGAKDLIAHISDTEPQEHDALNIPTFVGMFVAFGVSIVSIIAGFVIGQRSQARNID